MTFKNSKTKKSTAKKFRCVVKAAEEKPVELAMTAEIKGVKTIAVKFNQAVDTTKTTLTVAKGTAATTLAQKDAIVWSTDATEATLTTAGKLTEGTYTVSAKVAEDKTLTANAVVEKNETLTSFALVGETLKADSTVTTKASIEYKALNQYGEPMSCASASVTIAPGKMATEGSRTPSATKNGVAVVEDIPEIYTTPSLSEFSVVIVDSATGVNFSGKVKYGASAKAAKVTSVGLYNTKKGSIQDMTAGDKVEDYKALFTVEDQYGDPYTVKTDDVKDNATKGTKATLTATAASGLTNVATKDWTNDEPIVTVNEKDYFAIPLKSLNTSDLNAKAGDFSIMVINSQVGQIGTPSYTVSDSVLIQSIDISYDAVYAGQKNTLSYSVTDTKGNAVTKYDDLKTVKFSDGSLPNKGELGFVKNPDGTAKLVYTAKTFGTNPVKSNIEIFTVTANEVTSSNYIVKTVSFTVLADRKPSAVVGVSSSFATSTSQTKPITIKLTDLLIEDQYGSTFTTDELKNNMVSGSSIWVTGDGLVTEGNSPAGNAWVLDATTNAPTNKGVTGAAFDGAAAASGLKFLPPSWTTSEAIQGFKIFVDGKPNDAYVLKMAKVASDKLENITNLKIESINNGNPVYVTTGGITVAVTDAAFTAKNDVASETNASRIDNGKRVIPVVISGTVNGRKVIVDADQCDVDLKVPAMGDPDKGVKTEKATVTIRVSTASAPETLTGEFEVSNVKPALKLIKKNDDYRAVTCAGVATTSANGVSKSAITGSVTPVRLSSLSKGYIAVDQYGNEMSASDVGAAISYSVVVADVKVSGFTLTDAYAKKDDVVHITNPGMSNTAVSFNKLTIADEKVSADAAVKLQAELTVTATYNGTEFSYTVYLTTDNAVIQ